MKHQPLSGVQCGALYVNTKTPPSKFRYTNAELGGKTASNSVTQQSIKVKNTTANPETLQRKKKKKRKL